MNRTTRRAIEQAANERRYGIADDKGAEYTGHAQAYAEDDADVLANFKRNGDRLGQHPVTIGGLYFGKHVDSIFTFIKRGTTEGFTPELAADGEGIRGRLDDARNYLDLLECLLVECGALDGPPAPSPHVRVSLSSVIENRRVVWAEEDIVLDAPTPPHGFERCPERPADAGRSRPPLSRVCLHADKLMRLEHATSRDDFDVMRWTCPDCGASGARVLTSRKPLPLEPVRLDLATVSAHASTPISNAPVCHAKLFAGRPLCGYCTGRGHCRWEREPEPAA